MPPERKTPTTTSSTTATTVPTADEEPRTGRPRDPTRDAVILRATVELLGEVGYEQVTVRAIAQRAGAGLATLYRRWPTKEGLVVDAIASVNVLDLDPAPGESPYDALLRMANGLVDALQGPGRGFVPGLLGQLHRNAELAAALRRRIVVPRLRAITAQVAALRGVPAARADEVADVAELIPASLFFQVLLLGRDLAPDDVRRVVDTALAAAPPAPSP